MVTLRVAQKEKRIEDFEAEHKHDAPSEKQRFDIVLNRMCQGKRSEVQEASAQDNRDD